METIDRVMERVARNWERLSELSRGRGATDSFLKRRVLDEWRKWRRFPAEVVWERMRPVWVRALSEDSDRMSMITLIWWLEGLAATSDAKGRHEEARLWQEMAYFVGQMRERPKDE